MKTSNRECSTYVNKCEPFNANNIFAENVFDDEVLYRPNLYVVYSYGFHFPMYVYDYKLKVWVGNSDRYSVTTSKHMSQARPRFEIEQWLTTDDMRSLIANSGVVNYTIKKAGAL